MTKFSIIVPVYNTSKYLSKCLNSIFNQTYKDFELIIVNDGSRDNSEEVIKELIKDKTCVKYIYQDNKGLSSARNEGVESSNGDYIIFVDSDDYINPDLLLELSKVNNNDLIRYQACVINGKNKPFIEKTFNNLSGVLAFKNISNYKIVESAWLYAYNRKFYLKNGYKFSLGLFHEDFGLIPRIILEANSVTSINYIGYNYVERKNSIMTSTKYKKTRKKAFDMLEHYKYLNSSKIDDKIYKSFISNSVILKAKGLNKKDFKIYTNELKKLKVFDNALDDSLTRKLKKCLMKLNLRLYLKVIK
ncbi:MAG: glycosyltransferase [bacterium]|nr:glycosyltransferase [bacterium]